MGFRGLEEQTGSCCSSRGSRSQTDHHAESFKHNSLSNSTAHLSKSLSLLK